MKKRLLASLLSLAMVLTMLPSAALAVEDEPDTGDPPQECICETLCTEEAVNTECPVCAEDISACTGMAPEEDPAEPVCAELPGCVDGVHDAACPLYVAPEEETIKNENPSEPNLENSTKENAGSALPQENSGTGEELQGESSSDVLPYGTAYLADNGETLTIVLSQTGTLKNLVEATEGYSAEKITSLTISTEPGASLDFADFSYLREELTHLSYLDLSKSDCLDDYDESNPVEHCIPQFAMNGCTSLETLILPTGEVNSIGEKAFFNCSGLRTELTIPGNIETIGRLAFSVDAVPSDGGKLAGLQLCEGVKEIGYRAFDARPIDGSLTIPSSVELIGYAAFKACGFEGALTFAENSRLRRIDWNAFLGCDGFTGTLTLPDAENLVLSGGTFAYCTGFTGDIVIPDNVVTLGTQTFYGCTGFNGNVVIGDGITEIPANTFTSVTANGTLTLGSSLVKLMDLPDGLTGTLSFPSTLEEIGGYVFLGCTGLTGGLAFPEGLKKIGDSAFRGCTGLNGELSLPSSIEEIGGYAFQNCRQLSGAPFESLDVIKKIGTGAFQNCSSLTGSIYLPSTLTEVANSAFYGCTGLDGVLIIPDSVTTIGSYAFYKCSNLNAITLGNSVITIGPYAFTSLKAGVVVYVSDSGQMDLLTAQNHTSSKTCVAVTNEGSFADYTGLAENALAEPIQDGYKFEGWYSENGIENGNWGDQVSEVESGKCYYAKWSAADPDYDIETDSENVSLEMTYGESIPFATVNVTVPNGGSMDKAVSSDLKVLTAELDGTTVTITPVAGLDAGTYEKTIYVYANDGEDGAPGSTHWINVTLTVKKATPSLKITPSSSSITGGSDVTLTISGLPTGAGATVTASPSVTITGSGSTFTATLPNSSQTYTFTATYTGDDNHSAATATCTVSVDRYSSDGGSSGGSSSSTRYTVSVEDTDNGSIRVSPTRAERGDTVTITIDPDTGYELDELIVTDSDGDEISVRSRGDGRYTFTMPRGRVTVEATFVEITEDPDLLTFTDVPESAYYYDAVYWAVENGVTNGTSASTFSPNASCTRAQMVTFLWRAHGSPKATGANPFTDVSTSDYYYDAVLWAVANGVTNGTSATTFSPDAPVTRAQAVTFQWRAAGSPVVSGSSFGDVASDAYYADAVAWAASEGVTSGTSATTFSPDNDCTRGQIVTFLHRELG